MNVTVTDNGSNLVLLQSVVKSSAISGINIGDTVLLSIDTTARSGIVKNITAGTQTSTTVSSYNIDRQTVGDTTPPTVLITNPVAGSTISAAVQLRASASDNVAVDKVLWYIDNVVQGTSFTAPDYPFWIDTTKLANGSHIIKAIAQDKTGNRSTPNEITVSIQNGGVPPPDTTPPTVSITSPTNGSVVTGTITVSANATDNVGVVRVEFYRDTSVLLGTDTNSPFSTPFDTMSVANGSHIITAKAYDAAGNNASASVTVQVNNPVPDTTPPTVQMDKPLNISDLSLPLSLQVTGTAADNVGVAKVEVTIDGGAIKQASLSPSSWNLPITIDTAGSHTVTAKAYDAANNASLPATLTINIKPRYSAEFF